MSDNHRHEPQDERLERLIRDKQPTGNTLLDDLAGTVPRANPEFQQSLEDRLLASLKHNEKRNAHMNATDHYPGTKKVRWFSVPLTLAAAMLAVILASGVLLSMSGGSPNLSFLAQAQPSATLIESPTFVPTPTPIVGTLPVVAISGDGAPITLYVGPTENADSVIGQLSSGTWLEVMGRTDDNIWLYVRTGDGLEGWIKSQYVQLPVVDLTVTATPIPANVVILPPTLVSRQELISLLIPVDGTIVGEASVYDSFDRSAAVIAQISPGTAVQVTGTTGAFVDNGEVLALLQIRLEDGTEGWVDARLVEVLLPPTPVIMAVEATPTATPIGLSPETSLPATPQPELEPIVIALHNLPAQTPLTAEDLAVVYWPAEIVPEGTYPGIEALLGISPNVSPQREVPQWQPLLATDLIFSDELPPGKVAVSVPLQPSQAAMSWLVEGSTVDIYASMLFVDADEQFQPLAETPASANLPTPVPGQEPQLVTQRVIDDAQVIQVGSINEPEATHDVVVLAVSPDDATVLTWMVEGRLPIFFLPHDAEPVNVEVGSEIMLLGYSTDHEKGGLEFTLYWYAHEQPVADYSLSVNVVNEAGELVVQHDGVMADAAGFPTSHWEQNVIVTNESTLDYAEAPGDYTVSIALFSASDGVRLTITSFADSEDIHIEDNLLLLYSFTQE